MDSPDVDTYVIDDMDALWGASADCDCPGPPPPEFLLPPPPRPPILQPADPMYCSEDPLPMETCDALPLIDPSYRSSPSFQTSAVIGLCSVLLGLAIFIGVILVWKHKRKVQNFLPCKTSPQNGRDGAASTGVIYEDLHDVVPRQTPVHHHHGGGGHIVAPSIEMIDVKNNLHYPSGYPISNHPPVFLCSSPGPDPYCSQDLYNPVYEQLSDDDDLADLDEDEDVDSELAPRLPPHSEDEFAEDELSLGGGNHPGDHQHHHRRHHHHHHQLRNHPGGHHHYGTEPAQRRTPQSGLVPRFRRPHEPLPPIPGSKRERKLLQRQQHQLQIQQEQQQQQQQQQQRSLEHCRQEFHEGMILDALLQFYPRVGGVGGGGPATNGGGSPTCGGTINPQLQQQRQRAIPSITQRLHCLAQSPGPYETVPVIGHLATFRPHHHTHHQQPSSLTTNALLSGSGVLISPNKPYSQDSAFGSDSGYSNHTAASSAVSGAINTLRGGGGCAPRGNNSVRRDPRRLSQLSADLNLT